MKMLKLAAAGALFAAGSVAHAGATFDNVKKKGFVQCGVSTGIPGFSIADSKGEWKGLDVDMCRAIAATMFGDASKFKVTPLNTQQRFTALQSGEVDVLTRNTTVTLTRDTTLGLIGVGVNYYDSQGVMVSKELGVKSAKELNGATVCVQPGTTTELNLADWFRGNKIEFKPVVIDKYDEIVRAFSAGRCDAFTTDKSQLASTRTTLEKPDNYVILPEDFSKRAARADGAPGRRAVVQRRALVAQRHAGGRGIRNHVQERRRNGQEFQPQHPAHSRRDAGHGQEPGRGRQVGLQHHQAGRQLWRELRGHARQEQRHEAGAWTECLVQAGWPDVRLAGALIRS